MEIVNTFFGLNESGASFPIFPIAVNFINLSFLPPNCKSFYLVSCVGFLYPSASGGGSKFLSIKK